MNKILIIGAGSAGSVTVQKCAQLNTLFSEVHLASRTLKKCKNIQEKYPQIIIHQCDADQSDHVYQLLMTIKPTCVINMALPYQDLSIMDACLKARVHYIDTANYEPKEEAKFCYKWQWDYHEKFKESSVMALLGCGFDPGVTNVFCAYAQKELFDTIQTIDIIDCNDGDHGYPFATNFNPEINIREITQKGKYWKEGKWIETEPLVVKKKIFFPEVGNRDAYLMHHEEIESLALNIKHVQQIRFWMTFSPEYLTHLRVLQNVGMTQIKPVNHNGMEIIPLQFLKTVLPNTSELGKNYTGKTCIGCVITGEKNGQSQKKIIYNVCHHQEAYSECNAHAVGFTTGVPAMIGAKLITEKTWFKPGVINVEQCDPLPFMKELNHHGLPWKIMNYDTLIS